MQPQIMLKVMHAYQRACARYAVGTRLGIIDNGFFPAAFVSASAGRSRAAEGDSVAGEGGSRRAERFRPLIQIVGVDAEFRPLPLVKDLSLIVKELPSGATVNFAVNATNEAGDSPSSPTVTYQVP